MKIQVFSDLHVDVSQPPPIAIGLDVGRTRVLCNPRGYPGENPNFNPALVVEVGS
jgi:hypothetical protein